MDKVSNNGMQNISLTLNMFMYVTKSRSEVWSPSRQIVGAPHRYTQAQIDAATIVIFLLICAMTEIFIDDVVTFMLRPTCCFVSVCAMPT